MLAVGHSSRVFNTVPEFNKMPTVQSKAFLCNCQVLFNTSVNHM